MNGNCGDYRIVAYFFIGFSMRQAPSRTFSAEPVSASPDRATLQHLAEQMTDIAHKMSRLNMDSNLLTGPENGVGDERVELSPAILHEILLARRARSRFFSERLFADPAWDILLDLLKSRLSDHRESVKSVCMASNVPPTTALRWIRLLENEGLVRRRADPFDGRRFYIELTEQADASLTQYFASVRVKLII